MNDEQPFLINQSIQFVNLMFWFFAIVGMGIIAWNYRDDLADSVGKVGKAAKKVLGGKT